MVSASRDDNAVAVHRQIREIPITVGVGGDVALDASVLNASDSDKTPDALVYTLQVAPVDGALLLSGSPLPAGGTFTQADVDDRLVRYAHGGAGSGRDDFELTLSDGAPRG